MPHRPSIVDSMHDHAPTGTMSPKPAVVSVEKLSQRKSSQRGGRPPSIPNGSK